MIKDLAPALGRLPEAVALHLGDQQLQMRDHRLGARGPGFGLLPAINLTRADIGPPRYLGDDGAWRKTRLNDRSLLFIGPTPSPLRTSDHLNARHSHRLLHRC